MELYLLRHGIAVERGTEGYEDDAKRPLTPKGERKMKRIAEGMKKLGLSFDLLLSSRFIRARQTAGIVADNFKAVERLKFTRHLAPDGDPEDLIHDLARLYHRPKSALLIGHEPYLSGLMATLLAGKPGLKANLKKGGLCLLTVDSLHYGPCATLEWLLTPRQMTRLAR
jgi:phosphohistidine phosphatase